MKVKFEIKTNKIKGLCFHPEKSWILMSTYKGDLQVWDYRVSALINSFNIINEKGEISDACIRCASFHFTQPIIVAGGHDKNLHFFNYRNNRKMMTLSGHADYIRSVYFHKDRPWVISASDDTTIRIWNWQNKTQLIMITGHTHYVMCAKFHPIKNLIVSGSLDRTVRIWDYSKMVEKTSTGTGHITNYDVEQIALGDDHDNGVNWISIDEVNDLIYSAGDDRKVRIWKIKDSKGKMEQADAFFGHSYNVCSVVYNKKTDLVISNSEDCTMKVWNRSTGVCLETFKRTGEKQWILDSHPKLPFVATGTDNSLIIFALEVMAHRSVSVGNQVFFMKDYDFVVADLENGQVKTILKDLNKPGQISLENSKATRIVYNYHNSSKHSFILKYGSTKVSEAKLIFVEVDKKSLEANKKTSIASNAVFIGKQKIALLSGTGQIEISDTETMLSVGAIPDIDKVDDLFMGPVGKFIYRKGSTVYCYDSVTKKNLDEISEFNLKHLKNALWNKDFRFCVLACKRDMYLMNKAFKKVSRIQETSRIIHGFWTKDNVFVYSTYNHLKYLLPNGDKGLIKSVNDIQYPVGMIDDAIFTVDIDNNICKTPVGWTECKFKTCLMQNDIQGVKGYIKGNKKLGEGSSMISYLQKKNYPGVALSLTQDQKSKFQLALKSGNLQTAYESAAALKSTECFDKLASEALLHGCYPVGVY